MSENVIKVEIYIYSFTKKLLHWSIVSFYDFGSQHVLSYKYELLWAILKMQALISFRPTM